MSTLAEVAERFETALTKAGHPTTWNAKESTLTVDGVVLVAIEEWGHRRLRHAGSGYAEQLWTEAKRLSRGHLEPVLAFVGRIKEWEQREGVRLETMRAAEELKDEFDVEPIVLDVIGPTSRYCADHDVLRLKIDIRNLKPHEARVVLVAARDALAEVREVGGG